LLPSCGAAAFRIGVQAQAPLTLPLDNLGLEHLTSSCPIRRQGRF
jgi:hypothetical protein